MRIVVFIIVVIGFFSCQQKHVSEEKATKTETIDWSFADSIKRSIGKPVIPDARYEAADYGILPQNLNNTTTFKNAIDRIASDGGGTLIISPGIYYTGPIHLKSNVHLQFKEGVVIKFLPEPELYQPVYTWFYGIPCMNYSPMIYARNETNIKISGKAILDGQGDHAIWKNMKYHEEIDWDILTEFDDERVDLPNRVFGPGHHLRSDLIGIVGCKNVLIEDVSVKQAPLNPLHLILSTDVIIQNISVKSKGFDQIGIVPESSENIWIKNVTIRDCVEGIMLKSGQGKNEDISITKNIVIENVDAADLVYNGIGIGTEIKGGVENVFISNSSVRNVNRAFAIKTDTKKKGPVHNIFIDSLVSTQVFDEVVYCYVFHGNDDGKTADISNIHLSHIIADSSGRAFFIEGSKRNRIKNITLSNSEFHTFKTSYVEDLLDFRLNDVQINDENFNEVFNIGEISNIDFYDDDDDMETLDEDDIELSELPERIRKIISENYNMVPVDDIDRMITKTGAFYEIDLQTGVNSETELIISDKGSIIRREQEITFSDLPVKVLESLQSNLNTPLSAHLFRYIRSVEVEDFRYYNVAGETETKFFMFQVNEKGDVLEEKTKVITYAFPTKGEFEK